jgi:SAM-dependent methyltransferase
VEEELRFPSDLYEGTAPYYDRFRPPYPNALLDDLRQRLPVSGNGTLLDLACGTGQIALRLAGDFIEVYAVDQEAESVAYGRNKAEELGSGNVKWIAGTAEEVMLEGRFELVTIGNAFHRLNRPLVSERVHALLRPRGGLALLWTSGPASGAEPWQRALQCLLVEWTVKVNPPDRVPNWKVVMDRDPHEAVLRRAGFDYVGWFEFAERRVWTLESLAGYVYSTSFLSRTALADRVGEFEQHLGELLSSFTSDGIYEEVASSAYQLARIPG